MGKKDNDICGLDKGEGAREAEKCREPKHGGPSGRCIFHAPLSEKEPGEFWVRFRGYLSNAEKGYRNAKEEKGSELFVDCRKFIFPENTRLEFHKAFNAPIWFDGATFKERVIFDMAEFKGGANFRKTIFEDVAVFIRTRMLTGQFNGAVFEEKVTFQTCSFAITADFNDTHFLKEAIFSNNTFGIKELFTGETSFNSAVFEEIADLRKSEFNMSTNFRDTVFKGGVSFNSSVFNKCPEFRRTRFNGEIKDQRRGHREAVDKARRYMGEVYSFLLEDERISGDFSQVLFQKGATFWRTEAEHGVDFVSTQWDGPAAFYLLNFSNARFLMCSFSEGFMFLCSVLRGRGLFWRCALEKLGHFYTVGKRVIKNKKGIYEVIEPPRLDLISLILTVEPGLEFRNLPLNRSAFAYTRGIEKVVFENVKWGPDEKGGRKLVWDEIYAIDGKVSFESAATVYALIRSNYESRSAFETASDFHIGQMEMVLRNPDTNRFKRLFLRWYGYISLYGENVEIPILWFLLTWAFFTAIWMVQPFVVPLEKIIGLDFAVPWKLWPGIEETTFPEVASYFAKKTLFTLKTFFTISRSGGVISETIAAVQRLLGVGIITLFILALRRAFRR